MTKFHQALVGSDQSHKNEDDEYAALAEKYGVTFDDDDDENDD